MAREKITITFDLDPAELVAATAIVGHTTGTQTRERLQRIARGEVTSTTITPGMAQAAIDDKAYVRFTAMYDALADAVRDRVELDIPEPVVPTLRVKTPQRYAVEGRFDTNGGKERVCRFTKNQIFTTNENCWHAFETREQADRALRKWIAQFSSAAKSYKSLEVVPA